MIQLIYTFFYISIAYFVVRRLFLEHIWFNSRGEYVVVTGCDSGFGFRLATKLASQGVNVFAGVFTDDGRERLEGQLEELKNADMKPGKIMCYQLDITKDESVDKMKTSVQTYLNSIGKDLWGLVNNAGAFTVHGPDDWCSVNDYEKSLNVNTLGAIRVTHAFLPLVKKAKGRVVTMGSSAGRLHGLYVGPYCAAKFAVEAYMDCLRLEMRQFGVSVHLLEPGAFKTELLNDAPQRERVNRAWKALPEETRIEYGEQYKSDFQTAWQMGVSMVANKNIDWVVDSYIHALFGYWPRLRYVLGWDAMFMFIPISVLPTSIQDWILCFLYMFHPGPKLVPDSIKRRAEEERQKEGKRTGKHINFFLHMALAPIFFVVYTFSSFLFVSKTTKVSIIQPQNSTNNIQS